MTGILTFSSLILLMLWGLQQISRGALAGFGTELRAASVRLEGKQLAPVLTGCLVATTLQSSTATALILAGFASQGILSRATAFFAILGADIGTALAVIVVSTKIEWLPYLALATGCGLSLFAKRTKHRHLGKAINGIGLVLLSLALLGQTLSTLESSEVWAIVKDLINLFPIAAVILAVVLVYAAHSSLAIVLLAAQLHLNQALTTELAFMIVVGANLGGSALPLLSAKTLKQDGRLPLIANALTKTICCCLVLILGTLIVEYLEDYVPSSLQVVVCHLGLNLIVLLLGCTLTSTILRFAKALLSEQPLPVAANNKSLLDADLFKRPKQGLIAARREALRLADLTRRQLDGSAPDADDIDEILSGHHDLKSYVSRLMREINSDDQGEEVFEINDFAADIIEIAETTSRDLLPAIIDIKSKKRDVTVLHVETLQAFDLAIHAFASNDADLALEYTERFQAINKVAEGIRRAHFTALNAKAPIDGTQRDRLDLTRSYIAIASTCGAICHRVLTASGHVQKSKWKRNDKSKPRGVT